MIFSAPQREQLCRRQLLEVIAKNQEEAEVFILKDGLWGGALAERIAARIGKRGEGFAEVLASVVMMEAP